MGGWRSRCRRGTRRRPPTTRAGRSCPWAAVTRPTRALGRANLSNRFGITLFRGAQFSDQVRQDPRPGARSAPRQVAVKEGHPTLPRPDELPRTRVAPPLERMRQQTVRRRAAVKRSRKRRRRGSWSASTTNREKDLEPRWLFTNQLDCQDQLDRWTVKGPPTRRTIRAVPAERLAQERELRPVGVSVDTEKADSDQGTARPA